MRRSYSLEITAALSAAAYAAALVAASFMPPAAKEPRFFLLVIDSEGESFAADTGLSGSDCIAALVKFEADQAALADVVPADSAYCATDHVATAGGL